MRSARTILTQKVTQNVHRKSAESSERLCRLYRLRKQMQQVTLKGRKNWMISSEACTCMVTETMDRKTVIRNRSTSAKRSMRAAYACRRE